MTFTGSLTGTSTGWQAAYGDGQALFNGRVAFQSDYWLFDGQTGGGPGNWKTGFGFKVVQTSGSPAVAVDFTNSTSGIVDHITGVVLYPLMKRGQWAATTEVKLNYVAPVRAGVVETESTVLAMTNRSAVVRGELYFEGRLVCAAQGTLTIVDPKPR